MMLWFKREASWAGWAVYFHFPTDPCVRYEKFAKFSVFKKFYASWGSLLPLSWYALPFAFFKEIRCL